LNIIDITKRIITLFPLEFNEQLYFCGVSYCPREGINGIDRDIGLDFEREIELGIPIWGIGGIDKSKIRSKCFG
jgi:hypothetical protein